MYILDFLIVIETKKSNYLFLVALFCSLPLLIRHREIIKHPKPGQSDLAVSKERIETQPIINPMTVYILARSYMLESFFMILKVKAKKKIYVYCLKVNLYIKPISSRFNYTCSKIEYESPNCVQISNIKRDMTIK